MVDSSGSENSDEEQPKSEGFYFKALPDDYNPVMLPGSSTNINSRESF